MPTKSPASFVTTCGEAGRQQPILGQGWGRQGPIGGKPHGRRGGGGNGRREEGGKGV